MNRDIAIKWIADLRSPEAQQGKGSLVTETGHCCLGRLCLVLGHTVTMNNEMLGWSKVDGDGNHKVLPHKIMREAEIDSNNGTPKDGRKIIFPDHGEFIHLADANDSGVTFTEIATWIEANWRDL